MVTTQNPITGLSGIKKKTSLDIPSSSVSATLSRSLSPYFATSESASLKPFQVTTQSQLQHQKPGNPNSQPEHKPYFCKHESHSVSPCGSDRSSASESESDGKSRPNPFNRLNRNRSRIKTTSVTDTNTNSDSKTKSAFFKAKKKEKFRIRFEIEEDVKSQFDSGSGPYAKSSGDSGLTSSSYSSQSGSLYAASASTSSTLINRRELIGKRQSDLNICPKPNLSVSCNNIITNYNLGRLEVSTSSPFQLQVEKLEDPYSSQTLVNKKPKRTRSLKKLLTKSRSFVFSSSKNKDTNFPAFTTANTNTNSISRADLVAKYHYNCGIKSDANLNISHSESKSLPSIRQCVNDNTNTTTNTATNSNASKWFRGFKRDVVINQEILNRNDNSDQCRSQTFCKNCGNSSSNEFSSIPIPTPRYATLQPVQPKPHYGHNQKSWLGMPPEDIYFYGKYSKLPSEECEQELKQKKQDHPDFLSLKYNYRDPHQLQPHQRYEDKDQGHNNKNSQTVHRSIYSQCKSHCYNKCRKEYAVQQVGSLAVASSNTQMAHQYQHHQPQCHHERVEFDNQEQYYSYYDCRIPRPKLKFVIPTHSYGVSNSNSKFMKKSGRKIDIVDASGFTEISLSDAEGNDNEDAAYGSGSGSQSSKVRSEHSSDETLSEFEREQEQFTLNDERDYLTQVERIHSTEENSPLGHFPSDYTALYSCEKGVVLKGNSTRRLLSFKKPQLPTLLSKGSTTKGKNGDQQHLIEVLKSLPLFRKLSNGFLTKLSDHITEASYECGEHIVRQGSMGEGLFILISGTAKVTFLSNLNGEEIYLRMLHPGDFFGVGEKSLQGNKMNMMNVAANDETASCLIISEEGVEQLIGKSGEFRSRFCDRSQQKFVNEYFEGIELDDLRLISTLGIGGFGRVELVTVATDQTQSFALKQMKKCQIVATRQVEHIKSEKSILMETNCDFITKLYKTFKDPKYLYMLMECCLGGELWTILRDRGHFNDNTTRFYVGCVLEALKYLHSRNIIYRDLKPENLLLDAKGYLKLVDFGFAKRLEGNKTWTFCGTPEYVAPEVILNKGHDITADYWSLGVLMYELLTGTPPFVGGDPMRTYKLILKGIDFIEFPETIGKNAYNLIRKLCRENPLDRLGAHRGLSEIKRHKWFDGLEWNALRSKSLTPPIIPYVRGPHDCGNFDEYPPDRSGTPPDDLSGWDWDF